MNLFQRRFTARGAPPGTTAPPEVRHEPAVHVLSYDAVTLDERADASVDEALRSVAPGRVTWIDVRGLGDGTLVKELGERLNLHLLAVSDVVNAGQRPKVEAYAGELFVIVRLGTLDGEQQLHWEQVSLFLGRNYVLTFQETPEDSLGMLRDRIRSGGRKIRTSGTDYLACMVIDAIVDGYFPILAHYGERIEDLEAEVFESRGGDILEDLYRTGRELMSLQRTVRPLRDALIHVQRDPQAPFGEDARLYLRDTIDHTQQAVEVHDSYHDLLAGLVNMYLSLTAHRTNDVMRVLTLVATIFIPLSFLAGVYGMNFDTRLPGNQPELHWPYGYVFFWGLCLAVAGTFLALFHRLGWLRR